MSTTWRCPYCDTANNNTSPRCVVCDRDRSAADGHTAPVAAPGQEAPGLRSPHAATPAPASPAPAPQPAPVASMYSAMPAATAAPDPTAVTAPAAAKRSKAPLYSSIVVLIALVVGGVVIFSSRSGSKPPDPTKTTESSKSKNDESATKTGGTAGGASADGADVLPQLAITSPGAGASFDSGAKVDVTATIKPTKQITSASLLVDGQVVDTRTSLSLAWAGAGPGAHSLQVKAVQDGGSELVSEPVSIMVRDLVTVPTQVTIAPTAPLTDFQARSTDRLNVRPTPASGADGQGVGFLIPGMSVTVKCWVSGSSYSDADTRRTSTYWAYVVIPEGTGYAADLFLDTPKDSFNAPTYARCP